MRGSVTRPMVLLLQGELGTTIELTGMYDESVGDVIFGLGAVGGGGPEGNVRVVGSLH